MKRALKIAFDLCKEFEGLRLSPYTCPAGIPTIGYGSTYHKDGSKVQLTDPPIDAVSAELMLVDSLQTQYIPAVVKLSPNLVSEEEVLGAVTDFVYNLGAGRYRPSTLRARINQGEWEEAAYELQRWVRGGGRILPGLVRRRAAEAALLPEE